MDGDGPRYTRVKIVRKGGAGAYFLGFLGALVYYLQAAPTFWAGVLGFLKALVWPAFLVYDLLKFLHR
jgi:hypothetical protein